MKSKLVFIVLPVFCTIAFISKRSGNVSGVIKDTTASYRLVAGQSYFSGSYNGTTSQTYTVLPIYVVNYGNDSLFYWGTDTASPTIFKVSENPFMHLEAKAYKASEFKRIAIPPHRSQRILLNMRVDKEPDTTLKLKVSMRFIMSGGSNGFNTNNQLKKVKNDLSDSIILRYHHNHQMYFDTNEAEYEEKKQQLLLPTIELDLLTNEDRQNYILSIDQNKISALRDTSIYDYRQLKKPLRKVKFKTATVPVTLKNNSDRALAYYSMSCSWFEFYRTNTKEIYLDSWACSKNIHVSVTVAAHSSAVKYLTIFFNNEKPSRRREFKIGMNLTRYQRYDPFSTDFDQFRRYNVIWSNPVTLKY